MLCKERVYVYVLSAHTHTHKRDRADVCNVYEIKMSRPNHKSVVMNEFFSFFLSMSLRSSN